MQKTEKHKKGKKGQKKYTPFRGGLKSVQEVLPLFWAKKATLKILRIPTFTAFPEKVGGGHFFQKRPKLKGGHFQRGKK